jgi:adenylate kinase family enzyme
MKSCRIHIVGASGSGATSLGRALADALALPHHDTEMIISGSRRCRHIKTSANVPNVSG